MIQEIKPEWLDNTYRNETPKEKDVLFLFCGDEILVKKEKTDFLRWREWKEICGECADHENPVYLFGIGAEQPTGGAHTAYFLGTWNEAYRERLFAAGYELVRMANVRRRGERKQVFAAATAWQLYNWYRDNRFCGRCGGRREHDGKMRMLLCPNCGSQAFPKISPAVIVGVTDGDRILMTKYAGREYKNYALIAGFTEIGETAEETVRREVMEEVGLRVKNIRYYKSQPWGFDSDLLLGYFCELDGKAQIRLQEDELSLAEWVHYADIPDDAEGFSLTRDMMICFREERKR